MTPNRDTAKAWAYHDATKHSLASVGAATQVLDWTNQPRTFKVYRDSLPEVALVTGITPSSGTAEPTPADLGEGTAATLTLADLSATLMLSAGITKTIRTPTGPMSFRAAACTGALYHIELYVITGQMDGLDAGVYHFGAHDATLRLLREGDHRSVLAQATGDYGPTSRAPTVIVYTSTFWRNAWKYQARAYRHSYWDSGTIIANGLAVAQSRGLAAHPVVGFADRIVNSLIGVDEGREATVALMMLGNSGPPPPRTAPEAMSFATEPYSREEIDYPVIRQMHDASSLGSAEEAIVWRGTGQDWGSVRRPVETVPTRWMAAGADKPIEEVIIRRGSARRFSRESVLPTQLAQVIDAGMAPVGLDVGDEAQLNDLYIIANAVDGNEPGAFFYDRAGGALERLSSAETRAPAARLALGQALSGDAAFNCYFLADLHTVLGRFGNRGYRLAQLDASIRAGRMYLAAYAQGLAATGLTFFDDEVTAFFSPHAAGKSVMFLIAVGIPARRG